MKTIPTYCSIDVVPGNWVVLLSGTVHEVQSSPHGWFIEVAGVKVEQREYDPDTMTHGFNTKLNIKLVLEVKQNVKAILGSEHLLDFGK